MSAVEVAGLLSRGPAPDGDDWLTAWERDRQARLCVPKRRADWRLGRWTAKQAALALGLAGRVEAVEVRAAASGAPVLWLAGAPWTGTLSLSHSHGRALAVLRDDGGALGADLERVEERSEAFVGDYFTAAEQGAWRAAPAERRPLVATLTWSAKECAFKALAEGLRLPTAAAEAALTEGLSPEGWGRLAVRLRVGPGGTWPGYWRLDAGDVVAVVGPGLEGPPRVLA